MHLGMLRKNEALIQHFNYKWCRELAYNYSLNNGSLTVYDVSGFSKTKYSIVSNYKVNFHSSSVHLFTNIFKNLETFRRVTAVSNSLHWKTNNLKVYHID